MSRITINDYQKNALDSSTQVYTLSSDAVTKYGKKKTAGVPEKIIVHIPQTETEKADADKRLAEGIVENIAKYMDNNLK